MGVGGLFRGSGVLLKIAAAMKLTVTFNTDTLKRWFLCSFRHKWESHQDVFIGEAGANAVIAWKVCKRCAKSKLIHIL